MIDAYYFDPFIEIEKHGYLYYIMMFGVIGQYQRFNIKKIDVQLNRSMEIFFQKIG